MSEPAPTSLDLDRKTGLRVLWSDGAESFYPVAYLRRMSPSAEMREFREEQARNPLTVLPRGMSGGAIEATDAELVGNYAVRITFSDGHQTGIFTWAYLREIDPDRTTPEPPEGASA